MIRKEQIVLTTPAGGIAGTATSSHPISGRILEVRNPGTGLDSGGTADYTITRNADGGTILALTNVAGPWQYQPRVATHSVTGGTTNYAAGIGPVLDPGGVPCDDYVTVVIAQGGTAASGTIIFHYDDRL